MATPSENPTLKSASMDDHGTQSLPSTTSVVKAAPPKTRAFYLSFVAIMVTIFLSALDLTAVGTALPTIANSLHDTKGDYIWVISYSGGPDNFDLTGGVQVGSAYALSSTAFIPLSGSLADAFGRYILLNSCAVSILMCDTGSPLRSYVLDSSLLEAPWQARRRTWYIKFWLVSRSLLTFLFLKGMMIAARGVCCTILAGSQRSDYHISQLSKVQN
jgi:MFS family permease